MRYQGRGGVPRCGMGDVDGEERGLFPLLLFFSSSCFFFGLEPARMVEAVPVGDQPGRRGDEVAAANAELEASVRGGVLLFRVVEGR